MKESKLTPKQDLFCKLYATDREFFGNGTQAYIEAFDLKPKDYKTAAANASRLLTNANIIDKINSLLEEGGLNDQNIDKQLLFIINQHADFKSKVAAIREYNKLKSRINDKSEVEITHKYEDMTDEQLEAIVKARKDRLSGNA